VSEEPLTHDFCTVAPVLFQHQRAKSASIASVRVAGDDACEHNTKSACVPLDDNSHFSKSCLQKTPFWPSKCCKSDCTSGAFGQDCEVGTRTPVCCCLNAKNKNHPCTHACCKPCFDAWQTNDTPRKRIRSKKATEAKMQTAAVQALSAEQQCCSPQQNSIVVHLSRGAVHWSICVALSSLCRCLVYCTSM